LAFEKRPELRDPSILKRIFELRNDGDGFNNIAKIISSEFNIDITHPTAKNLYYEYAAKQKVKKETGEKVDDNFEKMLGEKFERIERITTSLLDAVETIKKDLTPELYLKHAPTIIAILRESLNQLTFIRNEQKEIVIKQQNLIYSPLQIMNQITQLEKEKEKSFVIAGPPSVSNKKEAHNMAEDEKDEE